ncbi:MAG: hypothetical protein KTR31_17440 [Myxococcales bacterium]|nr:hypothetical protein [Myxococcales bacterium]
MEVSLDANRLVERRYEQWVDLAGHAIRRRGPWAGLPPDPCEVVHASFVLVWTRWGCELGDGEMEEVLVEQVEHAICNRVQTMARGEQRARQRGVLTDLRRYSVADPTTWEASLSRQGAVDDQDPLVVLLARADRAERAERLARLRELTEEARLEGPRWCRLELVRDVWVAGTWPGTLGALAGHLGRPRSTTCRYQQWYRAFVIGWVAARWGVLPERSEVPAYARGWLTRGERAAFDYMNHLRGGRDV